MKTYRKPKRTGKIARHVGDESSTDYKVFLFRDLKDLDYAAGYLTAALEEGEDVFLLAVRDVVQAQLGMAALARSTQLNRESLYAMLSRRGNPRLSSIRSVLDRLGLDVKFTPKRPGAHAA